MNNGFHPWRWLDELERRGVIKRKQDVVSSAILLACLAAAGGLALWAALRR